MNATFIVDTNVVVSSLITRNDTAAVCRILDAMLDGAFAFALSPSLLSEYRQVLLRPKIARYHQRTAEDIDRLLEGILKK